MASNKKAHILAVIKYIFSIIGNNNANIIINDSDISGITIDRTKKGKYCYILQRYLIDSQSKVYDDLDSSMQLQMIDDEIIFKIYTNALKTLEDKNRFRKMMEK
ncbi:hypothetical protein [Megamonas rupellensis]|uniref:hypothetical protein n=1 Tax=Megamonas rupellensis TaxID=491921 RepID=UPI0003673E59|nr:hypothetical protein [Megamonas rupellensis]